MLLDEQDDGGFFSFLGPDDSTGVIVIATPPQQLSPASVQSVSDVFDPFQSPSSVLPIDGASAEWYPSPTWYPSVSPPAPETFFLPNTNPLDVINLGTRTDPVYVPRGSDERSLADIVGRIAGQPDDNSPSLMPVPPLQPMFRPRPTFESLTDLDFATLPSSGASSSSRAGLIGLGLLALFLLLD